VSAGPVVPGIVVTNRSPLAPAATSTATTSPGVYVTYIERRSGNIFSYSSTARSVTRTSNATVPGIQSALWLPNASAAYVRYLSGADFSTVNTYVLPIDGKDGFFLEQNLADIHLSATGLLTLASGVNGSIATLRQSDGTRVAQAFSSPLSSLRIAFAGPNRYLTSTKPSAALPGAAFLVDGAGRFSRLAGPLPGLVALPGPSGATVLVSSVTASGMMQMELIDTASGARTSLPVATIADKCVWTADSSALYCGIPVGPPTGYAYPDDWYQGAVSFEDRIWKINVAGRYAELVLDFSQEAEAPLDARSLALDALGTALAFLNKNDGSLWVYQL